MKKYALDLTTDDVIIDKRTEERVIIDYIETDESYDVVHIEGFFESDGTSWSRSVDSGSSFVVDLDTR